MSASVRQSELFAGNDWTAIYKAFTNVNLNAFDYNSILQSMVQYIKQNYPEVFNDWTDNDEYLVLLQLIANLAESLAFRMDINARENFFDLARRRESVLRLARFLSYNPKRNLNANGMIKITSIMTSDSIYDSNGNDLSNVTINWNDTTNQNWFEQFITVLNASFVTTNPFGTYLDKMEVNNITSQLYRFNNVVSGLGVYSFNGVVGGNSYPFEIVNTQLNSSRTGYSEVEPDLVTPLQIVYMNDGNGNNSNTTGFFSMFKQGTLAVSEYNFPTPIENRTIQIGKSNINENDLWVQTVNDNGYIETDGKWTRVGYIPTEDTTKVILTGDNITYNGVPSDIRNIYQDITQTDDDVILRFGDGRFGATPTGNLRIWYRVSANQNIIVSPDDFGDITVSIPYNNSKGVTKLLTLSYTLETTVSNASVSETIDQIRQRVGSVYATQGRMVSGDDYNSLPLTNQEVMKIKAINRIYSGQSRYIDLNDPTGNYQSTNMFCDDGSLYIDTSNNYLEVSTNKTVSDIVSDYISPIISTYGLKNFIMNYCINNATTLQYNITSGSVLWKNIYNTNSTSTGSFTDGSGNIITIGPGSSTIALSNITIGSLIKFSNNGTVNWATITALTEYKDSNNITQVGYILDVDIPNGASIIMTLPLIRGTFTSTDITQIENYISAGRSFGIGLNLSTQEFYYIDIVKLNEDNAYTLTQGTAANSDSSWIIYCEYSPYFWKIHSRNIDYIFESYNETKFFYVNTYKSVDPNTGEIGQDYIKLLKYNFSKNFGDVIFDIKDTFEYSDGFIEPRRVHVDFSSSNYNGIPDNPEAFYDVMTQTDGTYVFHKQYTDTNGYTYWQLFYNVTVVSNESLVPSTVPVGYVYFTEDTNKFFVGSSDDVTNYSYNVGTNNLSFLWKHLAPTDQRIDPSVSNIIDIFVLTTSYYNSMNTWRSAGSITNNLPLPPTEIDLQNTFSDLDNYKMFSDTIIWKPVKFKLVGGNGSDDNYKFSLKIIKLNSTTISDGQIKSNVITAVNNYFDVSSGWDFGDTFFASELIAYLHIQLADSIASVVLVPSATDQHFGDLFQIDANSDELFFPTLTVNNVEIISTLTQTNLRVS